MTATTRSPNPSIAPPARLYNHTDRSTRRPASSSFPRERSHRFYPIDASGVRRSRRETRHLSR
ncbi:hypothetical protein V0288_20145 [Pannus brasiliensis CCIBt3594]|uniref:Uncharacterized protein n=1 Tax=Pannus brasiliensis CCIBt3594 TaxID=1427578 RepID=A0AAW9R0U1_9CHRO